MLHMIENDTSVRAIEKTWICCQGHKKSSRHFEWKLSEKAPPIAPHRQRPWLSKKAYRYNLIKGRQVLLPISQCVPQLHRLSSVITHDTWWKPLTPFLLQVIGQIFTEAGKRSMFISAYVWLVPSTLNETSKYLNIFVEEGHVGTCSRVVKQNQTIILIGLYACMSVHK